MKIEPSASETQNESEGKAKRFASLRKLIKSISTNQSIALLFRSPLLPHTLCISSGKLVKGELVKVILILLPLLLVNLFYTTGRASNAKELRRSPRVASVLQAELDVPQMCLLLYQISLSKFTNCSKQSTVGCPFPHFPFRPHSLCPLILRHVASSLCPPPPIDKHYVQLGLHVLA